MSIENLMSEVLDSPEVRSQSADVADSLMSLGSDLPSALAKMPVAPRFTAVGVLYANGHLPHESVATELLFRPENVGLLEVEVGEDDSENGDEEPSPDDLYESAADAVDEDPDNEPLVAALMGTCGLDWPRGSGDYHGGKPASEMTPEEVASAYVSVCAAEAIVKSVFEPQAA